MFRLDDILDFLETNLPTIQFVPNSWKTSSAEDSVVVLLSGGNNGKHVGAPLLQFLVRATKESVAESIAYDLYEFFDYKTQYSIGGTNVIMSRGQQASPLYTGRDDNERPIYSVNILLTVEK